MRIWWRVKTVCVMHIQFEVKYNKWIEHQRKSNVTQWGKWKFSLSKIFYAYVLRTSFCFSFRLTQLIIPRSMFFPLHSMDRWRSQIRSNVLMDYCDCIHLSLFYLYHFHSFDGCNEKTNG